MKKIFLTLTLFGFLFTANTAVNAASLGDAFGSKLGDVAEKAGYDKEKKDPLAIVSTVIQVALSMLGVIFMILVIYGGFLWMTAAGDEGKVDSAKKIIKNSVIGLIIVVSAYAISYFVISKLIETTLS